MGTNYRQFPYDPKQYSRELQEFYIGASAQEIDEMLSSLGLTDLSQLFDHIPKELFFKDVPEVCDKLDYQKLSYHLQDIAKKNKVKTSFIGDGLKNYSVHPIVPFVSEIRGLSTAYTPYQPERSQGTLTSLYLYSQVLSMITGFEAINSSMYDRATCLYEAINAAIKINRKSNKVLVFESIYPGDLEVLLTQAQFTQTEILTVPIDPKTGVTDPKKVEEYIKNNSLAAIAFPQINHLGNLENVHAICDLCHKNRLQSIAVVDPMLLSTGGLIPPSQFGTEQSGADMIVGEGQHLAIGPNFGGPGLGIFGIRFNQKNKTSIRQTAGRYVGKAKDDQGNNALTMVLSTREQHIRREKAGSNICSNQAFIATLAGASILGRGEKGMALSCKKSRESAIYVARNLTSRFKDIKLAFNETPFFNEFVLELPLPSQVLIEKALKKDLHLGVDVSKRILKGKDNFLMLSFTDTHTEEDIDKLIAFFESEFEQTSNSSNIPEIPDNLLRKTKVDLPNFTLDELKEFYIKLGKQNISPDDHLYPLGSCTMKYNPHINDFTASLTNFTDIHPQAPIQDAQGELEILYQIQEMFKKITGLPAVTTQPVAGAQGELAGIKMFQAYHNKNGEAEKRDIILIPSSAHGTNPATATMAGIETKKVNNIQYGIIQIDADSKGQIDFNQLEKVIEEYGPRILGIMVTNPNTSGIFETRFKEMADAIHQVGGLVFMDGANMNAIAGWIDLNKMGVDAVHNNLHKTWSISHGGGGPGDAIVAVSDKLKDFLPGVQVIKENGSYKLIKPKHSIGSFHRHFGNFAHKIRCYTYLKALGSHGIRKMSAVSVLSARYLYHQLKDIYPTLPQNAESVERMHEFILTISKDHFEKIEASGTPKAMAIAKIGKLFLDFGVHAPTVAFPEIYGLMIEPTESFSKKELDHFCNVLKAIFRLITETPEVLTTAPHFTPVRKVDEVLANKNLVLTEKLTKLPPALDNAIDPNELGRMDISEICQKIISYHKKSSL